MNQMNPFVFALSNEYASRIELLVLRVFISPISAYHYEYVIERTNVTSDSYEKNQYDISDQERHFEAVWDKHIDFKRCHEM